MCALKINWELIDDKVSQHAEDEINHFIKNMKDLPDFLQNISIEKLSLGNSKPTIEILEVSNPKKINFDDFLETEEENSSKNDSTNTSQITKKSVFSSLSTLSSRRKLNKKKSKYFSLIESIKEMNRKLPEKEKIILRIPEPIRRIYPETHIHSTFETSSKRVLTSNLEEDDIFSESELFESLNIENSSVGPQSNALDFLDDGICLKLYFGYDGNASVEISAEFVLNQPIKNFVTFPINIHLSHFIIAGTLVIEVIKNDVKIYFERDPKGILKDYSLTVTFGSGSDEDVYIDKHQIETFTHKEIQKFIKNNLMFPKYKELNLKDFM
eukprot:gene10910-3615_t